MKKLLIIPLMLLTSCSVPKPAALFKERVWTVIEVKRFTAKAESCNQVIIVRNFDLSIGDTLVSLENIPVIK